MSKCFQCEKECKEEELSKPEGLDILICQDCLAGILLGEIKLKDIEFK